MQLYALETVVSQVLRRFQTNNPESAANDSAGHSEQAPSKRGSVYFLGSCSCSYLHKPVVFCVAGLIFLGGKQQ